jgi:hypothetical protein
MLTRASLSPYASLRSALKPLCVNCFCAGVKAFWRISCNLPGSGFKDLASTFGNTPPAPAFQQQVREFKHFVMNTATGDLTYAYVTFQARFGFISRKLSQ